jgi:DNA end-binding protein Ku
MLVRPYENGLIMHSLYYANEVRNFAEIAKAENTKLSEDEIKLGATLIESMSDGFEPGKYHDEYRERVHAMLEEKSIEKAKPKEKAAPGQRKRKTAS